MISVGDGQQRTITLEPYTALAFSAVGNALQLSNPSRGYFEEVIGIRADGDVRVLTVGRTDENHTGAGDYASYREIRLDRTEHQRPLPMTAWRLVGSSNGRAACYKTEPEPVIIVVAGGRCP